MTALKLVLFDIDGTLIDTGGAGARSWTWAFEHAFDRPGVDIGKYSSAGMTDPVVARKTFTEAIGHEPTGEELARLIAAYLSVLPDNVTASEGYRVLPGVKELLPRLHEAGVLLGVTTGAMEAGAHAKLGRARLNHFFLVGGYGSDSEDRVELTRTAVEARRASARQITRPKPGGGGGRHPAGHLRGPGRGCRLDRRCHRQIRPRRTARGGSRSRARLAGGAVSGRRGLTESLCCSYRDSALQRRFSASWRVLMGTPLTFVPPGGTLIRRWHSRWIAEHDRSGLGWSFGIDRKRLAGDSWERAGSNDEGLFSRESIRDRCDGGCCGRGVARS